MANYKVPQNVEAEDKILGPLSLKQFIYALIGLGYGFLTFAIFKNIPVLFVIIGLPPTLFMLALGLYQKEDQPFEAFFVGVLNFLLHPRKRFWEKEPIAEVFRVDPPPPKPEVVRRDPREVRGQLQRLAELVDTRGWNTKQPELQEPGEQPIIDLQDRIGAGQVLAPAGASAPVEVTQADDILDTTSAGAANLNTLMENTVKNIRQEALQNMKGQGRGLRVEGQAQGSATPAATPGNPDTANAIMKLATEGGDLTVAQIAAQAKRQSQLTEGQAVSLRQA